MKSMTAMNATRKQAGFTIIELVVVILLLGILTATALPRFMDVTDEAHAAVVDALEGGLSTGNALFRAQWVAEGQPLTSAVSEFNLFASAAGYPRGDAAVIDADVCEEVYEGVLQQGGRPEIATFTSGVATAAALEADIETASGLPANADAVVLANLIQDATIADSTTCNYYYIGQFRNGNATVNATIPMISYVFTTGVVSRTSITLSAN